MRLSKLLLAIAATLVLGPVGCANGKSKVKDKTIQTAAERRQIARARLIPFAGRYQALFSNDDGDLAKARLELKVSDLDDISDPFKEEPLLAGSLDFGYLTGDSQVDQISFDLQGSRYDHLARQLALQLTHPSISDLILDLSTVDGILTGKWHYKDSELSGLVNLEVEITEPDANSGTYHRLAGTYKGTGFDDVSPRLVDIRIGTEISTAGSLRVLGEILVHATAANTSNEVVIYELDQLVFDPLFRRLTLSSPDSPVSFQGTWSGLTIQGAFLKSDGSTSRTMTAVRQP